MIHGNNLRMVKSYTHFANATDEWCTPVLPDKDEGEILVGYPWGHETDSSTPFIVVLRHGSVVRTINALACAEIEFLEET